MKQGMCTEFIGKGRMEHFGPQLDYFLEIWHFTISENTQRKTEFINIWQVSLVILF